MEKNFVPVVQALIKAGASLDAQDKVNSFLITICYILQMMVTLLCITGGENCIDQSGRIWQCDCGQGTTQGGRQQGHPNSGAELAHKLVVPLSKLPTFPHEQNKKTALCWAEEKSHPKVVKLLQGNGS